MNLSIDRRIVVLLALFGVMLAALTGRLFYLQIIQHQRLTQLAVRQQERTIEVQPDRGRIFDRQGRPLAQNRTCASFFAVPSEIQNPAAAARQLSLLAGVPARVLEERFRSERDFVWVQRKVSDATAAAIQRLQLSGIHSLTESRRVYPEGRLACHVLGFVGVDNQGLDGIELQYERTIHGSAGWMRIARDARGQVVSSSSRYFKQPEPGQDVVLTLDTVVQHIAERELAKAVEKYHAQAGSILVMEPQTGEILALANLPNFDPNEYKRYYPAARRNRVVRDIYEPGSTFKLVTSAAALETGLFNEDDLIDCEMGNAVFNSRIVRDHIPYGRITFRDVVGLSSNIGAVKIGRRLGADRLVHFAQAFGFGKTTGVELPGEAVGLLKLADRWNPSTMSSVPYGQEVAVTTLQSAVAYAAVANDGWLPQPTLIKELRSTDGVVAESERPEVRRQVISPKTARRMRKILMAVVEKGTGTEARVPNYSVAGKTGTAQKPMRGGRGYDPDKNVASFIGFMPAECPRFLIAVVVDSPKEVPWGGIVAGPVFRAVGQDLVAYFGIPPTSAVCAAPTPAVSSGAAAGRQPELWCVPDFTGREVQACQAALQRRKLPVQVLGHGPLVVAQRPAAGSMLTAGSRMILYLGESKQEQKTVTSSQSVRVPNLSGQSLRSALQVLAAYGLQARISGSGIVTRQMPLPNTPAHAGSVCTLVCRDPEGRP